MEGFSNTSFINKSINSNMINSEFISSINGLSKIIKEYYLSTKKNLSDSSSLYNSFENQGSSINNLSNEIQQNNSIEKINDLIQHLQQLNQTKENLEKINETNINNLSSFLDKAKYQFKLMKEIKNKRNFSSDKKEFLSNGSSSKNFLLKSPTPSKLNLRSESHKNIDDYTYNRLAKNIICFLKKYDNIKDNLSLDENLKNAFEELDYLKKELKLQIENILIKKNNVNITNLETFEKDCIIKNLKEDLNKYKSEILNKQKEIDNLNKQLKEFLNEKKNLNLESDKDKTLAENTLNDVIKSYKQQINILNMEILEKQHLEEINKNLEYELSKLNNEINLFKEENYEGRIEELKENNNNLKEEINKLRNEILEKNKFIQEAENKNLLLQQQIDENSENLQNKENVIITLTESSVENNDKINNIQKKLNLALENNNLLKKKKIDNEIEISNLKDIISKLNLNEKNLNKISDERLSSINKLKLQLDEEIKANEKLRLFIKDLNIKLKNYDDTIDQLKNENFILNTKINENPIKEDNEKNFMKINLEKRNNEYVELRNTNNLLRNNLSDAENKLISLTKQSEFYKKNIMI